MVRVVFLSYVVLDLYPPFIHYSSFEKPIRIQENQYAPTLFNVVCLFFFFPLSPQPDYNFREKHYFLLRYRRGPVCKSQSVRVITQNQPLITNKTHKKKRTKREMTCTICSRLSLYTSCSTNKNTLYLCIRNIWLCLVFFIGRPSFVIVIWKKTAIALRSWLCMAAGTYTGIIQAIT